MNFVILTFLVSIVGIFVGSFINTVVFRTKAKENIWQPQSKCRVCEKPIAWFDVIPVVSYFYLKSRCRKCQTTIEWQYPVIEIFTGILFGLLFARAFLNIGVPDYVSESEWLLLFLRDAIISIFLLIIFFYDCKYNYILDRFSVPAMIAAIIFNVLLGANPINLILSGLIFGAFFAIQFIVSAGRWVGGGDVRMGMLMGLLLGFFNGITAMFMAYIGGAIVGVILILAKRKKLDSQVPFGAFLSSATLICMVFGNYIVNWYLNFLT